MSWNAARFARTISHLQPDTTALWLSRDAIARLEADGGYSDSVQVAVEGIQEAVSTYGQFVIGLAHQPDWRDGADVRTDDIDQVVVTAGDSSLCLDLAESVVSIWDGYEMPPDQVQQVHTMLRARVGGETLTANLDRVCLWFASEGDADAPHSVLKTVAAAILMFTDPQARDDAACVQSLQTVQVMKPAKAKRAKVSPTRDVHVIDVRRRVSSATDSRDGTRTVEHDHRWVVRGHWRNQPFGKGRLQRRRIWIQAHVAGPEDKPIRRDPTVYKIA